MEPRPPSHTLDPADWDDLRAQAHRMLDDILDHMAGMRERPVWQPIPDDVRASIREPLPARPGNLDAIHRTFMENVLPYAVNNSHPRFMGWVQGGGTPVGMLAEMLAAGLNANLGGRDQMPVEVERQIVRWMRELFRFPETANGLFVTGSSLANLIGVLVARTAALGTDVRTQGLIGSGKRLTAYTSSGAHGCVAQAIDLSGIGTDALRVIPTNARHEMDITALRAMIAADREAGFTPFLIVATAGTVDVGAIDPLAVVADIADEENLWFHVDGAFGALAMLSPEIAPLLSGIERADSIAFDFHKWVQVQYDAGFILVRDGDLQYDTFTQPLNYLQRDSRGISAGTPWPCDLGPDLSRSFRALKTWFTIKAYGTEQLGRVITGTCALAQYLKRRVETTPELELLAPVALNIVCFRYRADAGDDADRINADIVVALQEAGIAAPSTTIVNGQLAIRAAIVNHRVTADDIDAMLAAVVALGKERAPDAQASKRLA